MRFVAMVFRAYRLPRTIRRRVAGIRFTEVQQERIASVWNHRVWDAPYATVSNFWSSEPPSSAGGNEEGDSGGESADELREGTAGGSYPSNESNGDDDDGDGDDDESDNVSDVDDNTELTDSGEVLRDHEANAAAGFPAESEARAEATELLFGLIMEFSTEEIMDGRPASTLLVYFSGVLGFSAARAGFLPARSYTSYLAGLIYMQRLLFLEYSLPGRAYPLLGIAQRPRTDQVARFQPVRQKYMVAGSQSPFEELFSLLAYGRAVAGSDTPPFLLSWSDDGQTVSHGDKLSISMGQFRRLPEAMLEEASRLCAELMYDWNPPIDLSKVKDNLAETTHGFSFVTHPRNDLSEAYMQLCFRACTDQASSLAPNGNRHGPMISAYLKKVEALSEALGGLMLAAVGGQPRGPCLLDVRVRNHGTAERGLYVYNSFIMYLTRSHKAKRSRTGNSLLRGSCLSRLATSCTSILCTYAHLLTCWRGSRAAYLMSPLHISSERAWSLDANPGPPIASLALLNGSLAWPGAKKSRYGCCGRLP